VLHLGKDHRIVLIWIAVALALNVIAFVMTSGLSVPLNNQLAAAGDPASIGDLARVRADFESSWVRWNIVRAVLHTLAFLVLCGALFAAGIQHGRGTASAAGAAVGAAQGGYVAQQAGPGQFSAPQVPGRFGAPVYRRA
jgi:hypothetical protein